MLTKVDKFGPSLTKMDLIGPKWTRVDQCKPKWSKVFQYNDWFKLTIYKICIFITKCKKKHACLAFPSPLSLSLPSPPPPPPLTPAPGRRCGLQVTAKHDSTEKSVHGMLLWNINKWEGEVGRQAQQAHSTAVLRVWPRSVYGFLHKQDMHVLSHCKQEEPILQVVWDI